MTNSRTLLLGAALALLGAANAQAQIVTGSVAEDGTGAPLGGVLITLWDSVGAVDSGATLTDASGVYRIRFKEGRYRIHAERIGLGTITTDWVEVRSGLTEAPAILMRDEAIELAELHVDGRVRECKVDPFTAAALQRWWGEAQKAVVGASQMMNSSQMRLGVTRFRREWSPDLRSIRAETSASRTLYSTRPFKSAPADSLAAKGYVQGTSGPREFLAPDADVLLSDSFLGQHCFALESDERRPEWIGLHFEPTRKRKEIDILGVFWVDTLSSKLKEVQFTYANLPQDLPGDAAGGRVEFDQLPNGAWLISEWWVRMPQVAIRRERSAWGTADRYDLRGYVDEGGVVREVETGGTATDRRSGRGAIRGRVVDGVLGTPVLRARVVVTGTALSALTDSLGRFLIRDVPVGSTGVTFFHPSLSAIGTSSPVTWTDVGEGDTVSVSLRTPTFSELVQQLCDDEERVETVLVGQLATADATALREVQVRAEWLRDDLRAPGARELWAEAITGSDGRYILCRLPADTPIDLSLRVGTDWLRLYGAILEPGRVLYRESVVRKRGGSTF